MNVADEMREIIVKYKQSSEVILLGDMNASLFRDPPLVRDKYLKDILSEMNLRLPDNYPKCIPTSMALVNLSLTILFTAKRSSDISNCV